MGHVFRHPAGADLGHYGWRCRVWVNKGEALERGTKFRAGGEYGRGCPPPYVEENGK